MYSLKLSYSAVGRIRAIFCIHPANGHSHRYGFFRIAFCSPLLPFSSALSAGGMPLVAAVTPLYVSIVVITIPFILHTFNEFSITMPSNNLDAVAACVSIRFAVFVAESSTAPSWLRCAASIQCFNRTTIVGIVIVIASIGYTRPFAFARQTTSLTVPYSADSMSASGCCQRWRSSLFAALPSVPSRNCASYACRRGPRMLPRFL
jgi:hypothetical protein